MLQYPYALIAACLMGLVLSGYAYSVEQRAAAAKRLGQHYRAYCDVGPFSCTKVFSSDFGSATQLLGLPKTSNAAVGMAFYLAEVCLCLGLIRPSPRRAEKAGIRMAAAAAAGAGGQTINNNNNNNHYQNSGIYRFCLTLLFLCSVQSLCVSAVLAYILVAVLHDVCVVCCSIYVVNISIFWLCLRRRREDSGSGKDSKNSKTE